MNEQTKEEKKQQMGVIIKYKEKVRIKRVNSAIC